ncbi:MAG TPA: gluconate 2-dehydrogenase subunit 3 family protein [Steroidobacteraceae bacterium]
MIQATAAAMALPLVQCRVPTPKFFTAAEFALVDELSDLIIPTDAQSGGARAAGVAAYIDGRLAEAFEPEDVRPPSPEGRGGQGERTRWRSGLKAVEDLSRERHGKAFMESTPEQRLALLTRMAAAESDPKTPAEQFFGEIKGATIRAYYSSKVGIHDDQRYKGNVYQTGDYAGSDAT